MVACSLPTASHSLGRLSLNIIQVAPSAIVSWIKTFSNQYHSSTTSQAYFFMLVLQIRTCSSDLHQVQTGGNRAQAGFLASTNPLWIVHPGPFIGTFPAGWSAECQTILTSTSSVVSRRDYFFPSCAEWLWRAEGLLADLKASYFAIV
ncbi:uncharacterized protein F5147DRAFT_194632 [Suillus discolor]|uniref:Uncharacterized protein n=1 Tax=Suillus discolor TaxID=1912936 RepID=A0A9P7K0K0_9AGAM|nr:uncharacterized protein F5147DRAFT_194632 [Suillus discolor]KAG2118989.1 hypothetical protein F5147DRAFT_194632 [Suillus discolor]